MSQIKKILIVEDDIFISELYMRALKKSGYEVNVVTSGPHGLRLGLTGEYDLMILDLMIPDMIGSDVLDEIRKGQNQVPDMKIMIATNLEQDDQTRASIEELADGYVIKADITPKVLVRMVKEMEAQSKSAPNESKKD